jgi:hypothetical protein
MPFLTSVNSECYRCNAQDVRVYINENTNNSLGTWADDQDCTYSDYSRYSVVRYKKTSGRYIYACLFKSACVELNGQNKTVYIGIEANSTGCLKDDFNIIHIFQP